MVGEENSDNRFGIMDGVGYEIGRLQLSVWMSEYQRMPTVSTRYQRYSDCRTSLEESLRTLVDQARANGWTSNEIAAALVNFAVDFVPDTRRETENNPQPSAAVH